MKRAFRRYVLSGDFEGDVEQGYKWFTYATIAILVLSAVWFGPVVFHIFFGR
jgi:hypothetical protein